MLNQIMRKRKYTWDDLSWKNGKVDVLVSHVSLFAGEYLEVEEGWEIDGPIRLSISYRLNTKHTRIKYKPLRRREFDLDNPLEYPCVSCGADRLSPCIENNPECVYRVFYLKGGLL